MLTGISIHNYNCFVDFELQLPRRALLVGSNGSGKSSLWEALASLQDLLVRNADVVSAFPTGSLTRWLRGQPEQRFAVDVEVADEAYHFEIVIGHDVVRRIAWIQHERLTAGGALLYESVNGEVRLYGDKPKPKPRNSFQFTNKRSFLPDLERRHDTERALAFRDALAGIWLIKPSQQLDPTTTLEAPWLDRDGKNFAAWLRGVFIERPSVAHELLEALRPTLPGLHKVAFERISSEVRELMLSFRTKGSDYKLSVSELSDGQRTLLLLYGFLHGALERPALAFLDEPETGLAPHEMQPYLSTMSAALDEHGGQALVISHHPAVIDYLAPARTLRFSRPGGGPARVDEVTLETTGGTSVSEWLSRPWVYEDEHEEPAA